MTAPTLAWGRQTLYRLPDELGHVLGREFELLPAGTMFAAGTMLNGVVGVAAEPIDAEHCSVEDDAELLIIGTRSTDTDALRGYQDDIADGYRQREAMEQHQG